MVDIRLPARVARFNSIPLTWVGVLVGLALAELTVLYAWGALGV